MSKSYLEDNLASINEAKKNEELCKTCMEFNLPQYNMGFNRNRWEQIGSRKKSNDSEI